MQNLIGKFEIQIVPVSWDLIIIYENIVGHKTINVNKKECTVKIKW
jgi:hypothetical protein